MLTLYATGAGGQVGSGRHFDHEECWRPDHAGTFRIADRDRGLAGLGWDGEGFEEDALTRSWLFGKAVSIYGGSQNGSRRIAKRILGC